MNNANSAMEPNSTASHSDRNIESLLAEGSFAIFQRLLAALTMTTAQEIAIAA
jgi:hypothetical protein